MVWALKGRRLFSEPLQEGVQGAFFWILGRPREPISEPRKHVGHLFLNAFPEPGPKRFLADFDQKSDLNYSSPLAP